jgi:DNA-binding NarL/FixJ family response regulator
MAGQSLADLEVALGSAADARRALANMVTFLTLRAANPDDARFFSEKVGVRPLPAVSRAIRRILGGGIYVSEKMSDKLLGIFARTDKSPMISPMDLLTDREIEVFEMTGRGHGTSEIAQRLHLSIKTIETYKANVKEKLGLKDASELRQHAMRWVEAAGLP